MQQFTEDIDEMEIPRSVLKGPSIMIAPELRESSVPLGLR